MQCVSCHKVIECKAILAAIVCLALSSSPVEIRLASHFILFRLSVYLLWSSFYFSFFPGVNVIQLFGTNLIPKIQNGLFSPNRYKNAIFQAKIYCKIINCFYKWPIFWLMIGQKKRFSRFRPKKFCNIVLTDNPRLNPAEVDEVFYVEF